MISVHTVADPEYTDMNLGTVEQHQFHWVLVYGDNKELDGYRVCPLDEFNDVKQAKQQLIKEVCGL